MRELTNEQQWLAYRFADVATPSDAIDCEPWTSHADGWRRQFTTREWVVAGFLITVGGEQTHRGDLTRWMHLSGEDRCNTTDRMHLIAALFDAGEFTDSLTTIDRPVAEALPPKSLDETSSPT